MHSCLVIAVSIILLAVPATATCSHQHLGSETWCEASHPHPYFKFCSDCGEKVYIGGYATKAHGDGSWGSGTCPYCGTHEYIGQTCVTSGTCVCGATGPALGHNFENQIYSEVAHPHYYFRQCLRCGYHYYTGGHATKNHGDGSWGSGTCPDCGSHSYTGQSCTNEGVCACGATIPALGHIDGSTFYNESAHPHREYTICRRCGGAAYTGQTQTLPHGDGTNGTCSSCGIHFYNNITLLPPELIEHPHTTTGRCDCGLTMNFYNLVSNCTTCRTNEKTAYNKKTEAAVFVFIGSAQFGSGQIGVPICVPVQTIVEYTSKYNHPANDIFQFPTSYNYPNFASFFTLVTANVTGQIPDSPPIMCIGGQTARYYNGSTLILTQSMDFVVVDATHHNACVSDVWTLGTNPTTVEFNGLFYMLEGVSGSKTTSSSAAFS